MDDELCLADVYSRQIDILLIDPINCSYEEQKISIEHLSTIKQLRAKYNVNDSFSWGVNLEELKKLLSSFVID